MRDRLTRPEVQRLTAAISEIMRILETALDAVFDEEGNKWTERKLRVGAAMSAVELGLHSKLQPRRALWHASMVLLTLKGVSSEGPGGDGGVLESVAAVAHTLSLASIACDSEVASEESVQQTRAFVEALGEEGSLSWHSLLRAHAAAQ